MSRFNLQFSAGQVFGILADGDAHENAEAVDALAEIARHCDYDARAAWINHEIAGLDLAAGGAE